MKRRHPGPQRHTCGQYISHDLKDLKIETHMVISMVSTKSVLIHLYFFALIILVFDIKIRW